MNVNKKDRSACIQESNLKVSHLTNILQSARGLTNTGCKKKRGGGKLL